MATETNVPFYVKASLISIGLLALGYMLVQARDLIVPVMYATLFAILLNPLVNFFYNRKINRIISIVFALLIATILAASLFYFIASQLSKFSSALPGLQEKFDELVKVVVAWYSTRFHADADKIHTWLQQTGKEAVLNSNVLLGQTLSTVTGILFFL